MVTKSVKRKPLVQNLKSVKPTVLSVPERIRTSDARFRKPGTNRYFSRATAIGTTGGATFFIFLHFINKKLSSCIL